MRIASWSWGGRPRVGTISPCGRDAAPLAVAEAGRGTRNSCAHAAELADSVDVIATVTLSAVGMGFSPPRWLAAGDFVRVDIEGIGAIGSVFK